MSELLENSINNKDIQRLRTMSYFIEAAHTIIESEGIEGVTVRKVAKIAGYNPATVYNYFDNLEYLVGFASIKYLTEYHMSLQENVEPIKDPRERFMKIWEIFCQYSFRKPRIYRSIFFTTPKYTVCELFDYYFRMFPEELENTSLDIQSMLRGCTIQQRNMSILKDLYRADLLDADRSALEDLNEIIIYMYKGMLYTTIDIEKSEREIELMVEEFMRYLDRILDSFSK